jgi:hypothetical protein
MLVCLSCWEVLDRTVMNREIDGILWCPKKSCGSEYVVELDECLIPVIIELNEKGYNTLYCCSGHFWEYRHDSRFSQETYIKFGDPVCRENLLNLPPGFVVDVDDVTIRKKYNTDDPLELHLEILRAAIDLTKWARGLPELPGY